ncbi:hypothetical protein AGR3A_Lc10008 [Agrobacterium tomkonis CFBP 6623]|uniref:Uncharacterized protein n=1 Tax=Agrobacterium tomkonis CFBP 6623 TaxID=1183432 RepID=A0A1S7QTM7_9HYPH|nr:hypothetical protein AGR3A_Lc10008 [Agrobacterium tomkonis CFBP 6623]
MIFSPSFPREAHSGSCESQSFSATFDGLFPTQQLHPPPVAERQAQEGERLGYPNERPGDARTFHPRCHSSG